MDRYIKSVLLCGSVLIATANADVVLPEWHHVDTPFFPLMSALPDNPVLTPADVSEAGASLVADPFLFVENGMWFMFLEVAFPNRVISLATSADGLSWDYDQILLDEPFQLSYPFVFKHDGHYYMMPETKYIAEVRLYEATDFPYGWTYTTTLLSGRDFVDPVVVYRDNTWWLFVGLSGSQYCYLYFADDLLGPWTEHPMSPIVNDRSKARPAGRFIEYAGNHLIRLAQKCDVVYGEAVRAFQVDVLTRSSYVEHEIPDSPILQPGNSGWNETGMHQCDAWWTGHYWLAAVDGRTGDDWSIGIYQTEDLSGLPGPEGQPDSPGSPLEPGPIRLAANSPNPFTESTVIRYTIDPSLAALRARLNVYDLSGGRLVRTKTVSLSGQVGAVSWDGRDAAGRRAAAGKYLCELQVGDHRGWRAITLVR